MLPMSPPKPRVMDRKPVSVTFLKYYKACRTHDRPEGFSPLLFAQVGAPLEYVGSSWRPVGSTEMDLV